MRLRNLLALLLLINGACYAARRDTVRLFYQINQKELSVAGKAKLDSLGRILSDTAAVRILGYADYLGTAGYNVSLANQRAEIVRNYLLGLHPRNTQITAEGKGGLNQQEKNQSALGDPLNRRVDIITTAARINVKTAPRNNETLNPKKKDDSVYSKINSLSDLNVGESLSFTELTFQPGRHFLNRQAIPYLEALTKYLQQHENLKIEIQGHICCDYNLADGFDPDTWENNLSVSRAKFIYDYLVNKGIKAKRMRYKGLGSTQPKVYPERSPEDQVKNRRVQIVLLSK